MSTTPASHPRHALGLPAGSIRAMLALGILGYLWLLALSPGKDGETLLAQKQVTQVFIYLSILLTLMLAHFVVSHGKTIGTHVSRSSPLGLPRGTVRLLLVGGYIGLAYFLFQREQKFAIADTGPLLLELAIVLTAFIIGHGTSHFMMWMNKGEMPAWFQDIQAWFAILGMVILGVIVLGRFVINVSLPPEMQLSMEKPEIALAAIVGFYFGARS